MDIWVLLGIVWLVCALVATYIGVQRGFAFLGFLNGFCLGPLGLLIVMIQDDNRRKPCPHCAEKIMKAATICPHCQRSV